MRDYKHASKTFTDNNFELHPKLSNLFHVVFEFTPDAATLFDTTAQLEIPLLVKSADLSRIQWMYKHIISTIEKHKVIMHFNIIP